MLLSSPAPPSWTFAPSFVLSWRLPLGPAGFPSTPSSSQTHLPASGKASFLGLLLFVTQAVLAGGRGGGSGWRPRIWGRCVSREEAKATPCPKERQDRMSHSHRGRAISLKQPSFLPPSKLFHTPFLSPGSSYLALPLRECRRPFFCGATVCMCVCGGEGCREEESISGLVSSIAAGLDFRGPSPGMS